MTSRPLATACIAALLIVALTSCGMAETTAATAAHAEASIEAAKEGEKIKAKVEQDVAAIQAKAAEIRDAADE